MKNHILNSVFETAATLPNIEGVAALEQLTVEASSLYEGTEPAGFTFGKTMSDGVLHDTYYLHTKITDPWPLEQKMFCGIGRTPKEAFQSLDREMNEWFTRDELPAELRAEIAA